MKQQEITSARAESFLRIQRRDVFGTVHKRDDYKYSGPGESTFFRKRVGVPREKRRTAETQGRELVAIHLEATNKGYPQNFVNYDTHDERRNINYENNNEKFRGKKLIGHPNISMT